MIVRRLYLKDFLSYAASDVTLEPGLNVITGENAAGKTNFLDAVFLSAVGRSSRGYKDKELIRWGAEGGARLKLLIEKEYSSHTLETYIDPLGKRRILADELPVARIGELMGTINAVYFSPDEMKLIKESPDYRRRFVDISLSQQNKRYFYELQQYLSLLKQRNALLKTDSRARDQMADIVTRKMIAPATYILNERKSFLEELTTLAAEVHARLTSGKEDLALNYQTEDGDLYELYRTAYEKDKELRYTTVGPHRDDVKITAGGVDVRKFGSQGQQRTAVLSIKLAEAKLIAKRMGESPVVLFDDVLSELDLSRTEQLLSELTNYQTILTCTHFPKELRVNHTRYTVKENTIRREK